jgi:hypothetical protein
MGQSHSSETVKDKQAFTISTKAHLIEQNADAKDNTAAIHTYLSGAAFKKRATSDLNMNHESDKNIKIVVSDIDVAKNLSIKIKGTIKVLKKESEPLSLVEDSLKTSLSHSSGSGEPIPNGKGMYRVQFKESDTKVDL